MQWHSLNEFFAMGGYAPYVWGSVGACALAMLVEPWLLRRRHRQIAQMLKRRRQHGWRVDTESTVVVVQRQAA
jgi:heme exporter protein D